MIFKTKIKCYNIYVRKRERRKYLLVGMASRINNVPLTQKELGKKRRRKWLRRT